MYFAAGKKDPLNDILVHQSLKSLIFELNVCLGELSS